MDVRQVRLGDHANGLGTELLCPTCSGNNLHQRNVTIFEPHWDGRTIVMQQTEHDMHVTPFPSRDTCNPSLGQQGILIEMECESCHYSYEDSEGDAMPKEPLHRLAIYQHKGTTYVEWQLG